MISRLSVFIATSLDGCIVRKDGAIDWLELANASVPDGEDCGYSNFMGFIDALVAGRASFEKVRSFPERPYGDQPVYVLSASMQQLLLAARRKRSRCSMRSRLKSFGRPPHRAIGSCRALAGHSGTKPPD